MYINRYFLIWIVIFKCSNNPSSLLAFEHVKNIRIVLAVVRTPLIVRYSDNLKEKVSNFVQLKIVRARSSLKSSSIRCWYSRRDTTKSIKISSFISEWVIARAMIILAVDHWWRPELAARSISLAHLSDDTDGRFLFSSRGYCFFGVYRTVTTGSSVASACTCASIQ